MTKPSWIYRPLNKTDNPNCWPSIHSPLEWRTFSLIKPSMLEHRDAIVVIENHASNRVIGAMLFCPSTYVNNALCLTAIEVDPEFREKGIGQELVDCFLSICARRSMNATHTDLEDHPHAQKIPAMFRDWEMQMAERHPAKPTYIPPDQWCSPRNDYELSY